MGASPISFQEIDAFCRLRLVSLTAWEVGLLRQIDDAVLGSVAAKAKASAPDKGPVMIPADNPKAIGALLRSMSKKPSPAP